MANFFRSLDSAIEVSSSSGDLLSMSILERLRVYLYTGKFTSYKRAKELLSVNRLSWVNASKVLGITPDTVKRARYSLSKEVWELVGYDFFDKLDNGEFDYCESIVNGIISEEETLEDILPKGVSDIIYSLADTSDQNYSRSVTSLEGFQKELDFLVGISEPVIRAKVSNLDIGKLLVLLGILDGSLGNNVLRSKIIDFTLGKAGEEL